MSNCFVPELPVLQPMKIKDEQGCVMTLYADFSYFDPNGKEWHVGKGEPTDGATIPKWLWPVLGHPFDPEFINAAIIHDHFCRLADNSKTKARRDQLRKEADIMFYHACICDGCSIDKAFSLFKGVRIGASMPWSPGKETKTMDGEEARELYSSLDEIENIFVASGARPDRPRRDPEDYISRRIGGAPRAMSSRAARPGGDAGFPEAPHSAESDIYSALDMLDSKIKLEASRLAADS